MNIIYDFIYQVFNNSIYVNRFIPAVFYNLDFGFKEVGWSQVSHVRFTIRWYVTPPCCDILLTGISIEINYDFAPPPNPNPPPQKKETNN